MKHLSPSRNNPRLNRPQHQSGHWRGAVLAAAAMLCAASSVSAQTHQLDIALSSLTLSGGGLGGTYTGQGANPLALVDNWGGTLTLTPTTPGNFTFTGSITAILNPLTPFLPTAGGTPPVPGGVDNYGTSSLALSTYPLYTAYRDMALSITGGNAVQGGSAPVTGMTLGVTSGHLDFDAPVLAGFRGGVPLGSWVSSSGLNTSLGSVTMSPDGSTLTIPVTFTTTSYDGGGFGAVNEIWTGTLVAVVPEPSSVALVGLGLAAFAAWNIRRGKRLL